MSSGRLLALMGFWWGSLKQLGVLWQDDFCRAVMHFFYTSFLPPGVNATSITIIPKAHNDRSLGDFRPIYCCNVLCIRKLLANCLKV